MCMGASAFQIFGTPSNLPPPLQIRKSVQDCTSELSEYEATCADLKERLAPLEVCCGLTGAWDAPLIPAPPPSLTAPMLLAPGGAGRHKRGHQQSQRPADQARYGCVRWLRVAAWNEG